MSDREVWRAVVGYEGLYEVSDQARLRVDPTRSVHGNVQPGRILTQWATTNGYLKVALTRDGRTRTTLAHAVVAGAFLGPRPDGQHINHIDNTRTNNVPSNLEYVTPAENAQHASRQGRMSSGDAHRATHPPIPGERNGAAKLTEGDVRAIRAARAGGEGVRSIARRYRICRNSVGNIVARRNWAHVA